jgi:hypothetical protein
MNKEGFKLYGESSLLRFFPVILLFANQPTIELFFNEVSNNQNMRSSIMLNWTMCYTDSCLVHRSFQFDMISSIMLNCIMWCTFHLFMWIPNCPVSEENKRYYIRIFSVFEGDSDLCYKPGPGQDHIWCKWATSSHKWCQKTNATSENFRSWIYTKITFHGS